MLRELQGGGGGKGGESGRGEREREHGFYRPFTRRGSPQDEMRMIESVESQQRGESQTDREREMCFKMCGTRREGTPL